MACCHAEGRLELQNASIEFVLRHLSINGLFAGLFLGWLVLVYCERKILLAD